MLMFQFLLQNTWATQVSGWNFQIWKFFGIFSNAVNRILVKIIDDRTLFELRTFGFDSSVVFIHQQIGV